MEVSCNVYPVRHIVISPNKNPECISLLILFLTCLFWLGAADKNILLVIGKSLRGISPKKTDFRAHYV